MLCCIEMKINKYFQNSMSLVKILHLVSEMCIATGSIYTSIPHHRNPISGADYFAVVTMNKVDEIKPFIHSSKVIIKDISKKIGWLMKTNTSIQVHKRDKIAKD